MSQELEPRPRWPDLARDWLLRAARPSPTPSVTAKMALVAAAELAVAGVRERGGGSSGRKGRGSPA